MVYRHSMDAEMLATRGRFITEFGMPVLELMEPKAGEHILDVGCGDGVICEKLNAMGCTTVGVDISKGMVEWAKKRGVDARQINGESLVFNEEFDAVYTNSALHWMRHLDRVAAGVFRALKPGGRFVGEMGGKGSIAKIISATRQVMIKNGIEMESVQSWYFPSIGEFSSILERAGFEIQNMVLVDRPTVLPGDIADWLQMFGRHYLASWDATDRDKVLDQMREAARPTMVNEKGEWVADYVRLRFYAVKPA